MTEALKRYGIVMKDYKFDREEYERYLDEVIRIINEEDGRPVGVVDFFKAYDDILKSVGM